MKTADSIIQNLIECIELEEKEQVARYGLDGQHTLKNLKADGLAIQPISIVKKSYGYADYPEVVFRINYPMETNQFRDAAAIELFLQGEAPIKGVMQYLDGKQGAFRLYAPDFPDWMDEHGVGIKLAPNQRTNTIMKTVLAAMPENKKLFSLFEQIHGISTDVENPKELTNPLVFKNKNLNLSQKNAVEKIVQNSAICIIHGPPGTGKTTTLIEAIGQLAKLEEKILVSAPSNAAVDNIAKGLIAAGLNIIRVGNNTKVDDEIFAHTVEGRLQQSKELKEIKDLKIRAEEFRRMAHKYKRSFGKAEREQQNLLFKEVKSIRAEIKKLQVYNEDKLYENADVILGTPIGLYDANLAKIKFNTLVLDEAGQCLEPLAWCIFPMAEKIVLAGDHLQLPPTVLSNEAVKKGFSQSILESAISHIQEIYLLDTQYRMRESIAGFSSAYFYKGLLKTPEHLKNIAQHICFIDTAGSGFAEIQGSGGNSLQNEGELKIAEIIIETELAEIQNIAFISPYSGQVVAAKETLPSKVRINTIDSFQGQEKQVVILSLVRSNDEGEIGFLKDYRRMNVAITRAKEKLYILGDSATLGGDKFYDAFLAYIQQYGEYRSVWEMDVM